MTSFPAQARRVRDQTLPPLRRLYALRECTLHFAPYGFRATWHHLIVNAAIPANLDDDPDALVRAVDELAQARHLLLPHVTAYATQRRREKAAGRRVPAQPARWYFRGWYQLAYCPDPEHHPTARLATVVQRILDHDTAGTITPEQCPACATPRNRPHRACPNCGILPWTATIHRYTTGTPDQWRRIWSRRLHH